jgi:hypothetical protein
VNPTFTFEAELAQWEAAKTTWVYAAVPLDEADIIADIVPDRRGFGSIPVTVRIDQHEWNTSIFPMQDGRFFLPVKAPIRKKAKVDIGDTVEFEIDVRIED